MTRRMDTAPGVTRVIPTRDEIAAWERTRPNRRGRPYRVKCDACGHRFWLSGLGLGSHRRACKVVLANDGRRFDRDEFFGELYLEAQPLVEVDGRWVKP